MQKNLQADAVRAALAQKGWDQKRLAAEVGVSATAITNWLKGTDFPRPPALLKLSTLLSLKFDQLVGSSTAAPVIAFRKRAGKKTGDADILRAKTFGALLRVLAPYLAIKNALRTEIRSPSQDYDALQSAVASIRIKLGVGEEAQIHPSHLLEEFKQNGATIIPVMWGNRLAHENAIHILLPDEDVTFVYLNLDTHIEDFKFWMAHELAHVYTPSIAGKEEGEDFADAFAGALLFPTAMAEKAYSECQKKTSAYSEIHVLNRYANQQLISINTVYLQVNAYANARGLMPLRAKPQGLHAVRSLNRGALISEDLFAPIPPSPDTYLAAVKNQFKSDFFEAAKKMLIERQTGMGFLQQVLDLPVADARALHESLTR